MFGNISEIFGKRYTFVVNPINLESVIRHVCKCNKRCKTSVYVIEGYIRVDVRSNLNNIGRTIALLKNDGYILDVMNPDMHMHVIGKELA